MRLDSFLDRAEKILGENECVLFYEDWYCWRQDGASQKRNCDKIKKEFKISLYKKYSEEEAIYSFYKIK